MKLRGGDEFQKDIFSRKGRSARKANKKISRETRKGVFDAETEGCTDGGAEAIGEDRG